VGIIVKDLGAICCASHYCDARSWHTLRTYVTAVARQAVQQVGVELTRLDAMTLTLAGDSQQCSQKCSQQCSCCIHA
jgi:hypothetical protein